MAPLPSLRLRSYMKRKIAARRTKWVGVLPEEIWLMIISDTSDATLSALNRTCRAMNSECTRELQRRKEDKLRNLREAEASSPGMVVCSSCVAFHARPSRRVSDMKNLYWEIAPTFSNFDLGGPRCKQNTARVRLAKQDELDWWRAHLTMRSHRFGGMHGPPVSDMNKITIRLRGLWTSSTEALVHADHLLLKVQGFRLLGKGEDYTRHMPCCKHLKSSAAMMHELRRVHDAYFGSEKLRIPFASDSNEDDDHDPAPQTMLYRCSVCPFEFRLRIGPGDAFTTEAAAIVWRNRDVKYDKRGEGFMLCITSYVDLGKCIDPSEPQWTALAGDGEAGPMPYRTFHHPTIESRFEHHASLRPLEYDEIAISVG